MKKQRIITLCVLVILLIGVNLFAQTEKYKSRVSIDEYIQITIERNGKTVYYSKENIEADQHVLATTYNLSDIEFVDNKIEFPDNMIYWFIPFADAEPILLRPYVSWTINCLCQGDNGNGTCNVQLIGNGMTCVVNSGCSCCETEFIDDPHVGVYKIRIVGGGLIVQADKVLSK